MQRLSLLAAILVAPTLLASPASACSLRGQYCGYPTWAANAFEAPRNRVVGYATLPTDKPVAARSYHYGKKRHR